MIRVATVNMFAKIPFARAPTMLLLSAMAVDEQAGATGTELEPLRLPDSEGPAAANLRLHLRELILGGSLQPGLVISQVELAKSLGVSRTPLREALRMLQEEGLIEAEPNRRARVTRFNPGDLDTVYGCRVMLESLGCVLTVRSITDEEVKGLQTALDSMVEHAKTRSVDEWQAAHREFHRIFVARASDQFGRTIAAYQDRAERYWVMFIRSNGAAGLNMRDAEHRALFESAARRDARGTAILLAKHLSRTALTLMAQLAPEHEPLTVRTALHFVSGLSSDPG
jgi:DNA-binding GntR family transcriptional regulator